MTSAKLARILVEGPDNTRIDQKIGVYLNRVLLRIFNVPALREYLKDVALFQMQSGPRHNKGVDLGKPEETDTETDAETKPDAKNNAGSGARCKIQLVFHRLPDEIHAPLMQLLAAPRQPKLTHFVDQNQARTGIEMEVAPDDFGGEDYDYAF